MPNTDRTVVNALRNADSGTAPESASANRAAKRPSPEQGIAPRESQERSFPNAELARSFEPLRVVFALSALLLGVIASLRF